MEYNMETTNESTGSLVYTTDGELVDLNSVTTDVQIKDGIIIQTGTTE
jgi:hypothetical protein